MTLAKQSKLRLGRSAFHNVQVEEGQFRIGFESLNPAVLSIC